MKGHLRVAVAVVVCASIPIAATAVVVIVLDEQFHSFTTPHESTVVAQ